MAIAMLILYTFYSASHSEPFSSYNPPMETLLDRITFDPKILCGKPTVRGLRISAAMVLELMAKGASADEILEDYPNLEPEDIQAVLWYATSLMDPEGFDYKATQQNRVLYEK